MSALIKAEISLKGAIDSLPIGPWPFANSGVYTLFFGANITLATLTAVQVIGGVSPIISSITTVQFLLIVPTQAIKVGLHGVAAQSAGFTLNANAPLCINGGSLTSLSLYNHSTTTATIFLGIGGS